MKWFENNIDWIIYLTLMALSVVLWIMFTFGWKDFDSFSFYSALSGVIYIFIAKIPSLWKNGK
jgi:hypothetical protein